MGFVSHLKIYFFFHPFGLIAQLPWVAYLAKVTSSAIESMFTFDFDSYGVDNNK